MIVILAPLYLFIGTFGLSYLILRRTPLEMASFFVPTAVGIPFLIVVLSRFGYVHALETSPAIFYATAIAGPLISVVVAFFFGSEIRTLLRLNFTPIALCHILALTGYALPLSPHILNLDLGYFEFMNGEFMNYAQIVNVVMGRGDPLPLMPWATSLANARDGIDFLNVLESLVFHQTPANIVQITSAALRYSTISLVFFALLEVLSGERRRLLWGCAFCMILVVNPLDIYHYLSSFMAANLALLTVVAFTALLLIGDTLDRTRFMILAVIKDIFLLVTYPEIMPFAKIFEIIVACQSYIRGKRHFFALLALANLFVFFLNPVLVVEKLKFIYALTQSNAGVDILSNPQITPLNFLARIIGYEFPWLSCTAVFQGSARLYFFIANMALFAALFGFVARSKAGMGVLILPIFALLFVLQSMHKQSNYYPLVKVLLIFQPFLPLMFAYFFTRATKRSPVSWALGAITGTNFVVHTIVLVRVVIVFAGFPTFYGASFSEQVISAIRQESPGKVMSENPVVLQYWGNILSWSKAEFSFLSRTQESIFNRDAGGLTKMPSPAHEEKSKKGRFIGIVPSKCQWYDREINIVVSQDHCHLIEFHSFFKSRLLFQSRNARALEVTIEDITQR